MMRSVLILCSVIVPLTLLTFCHLAIADVKQQSMFSTVSSYRVTTEHPLEIYQGGSIEQALALSNTWRDKVLNKNPHILQVDYLLEQQSDSRYMLLVIYYYKDKQGSQRANNMLPDLIALAWPDKALRQQFFQQLQSYVVQNEKRTRYFDVIE